MIEGFNDTRVPPDEAIRRRLRELAAELVALQRDEIWSTVAAAFHSQENPMMQESIAIIRRAIADLSRSSSQIRFALIDLKDGISQSPSGSASAVAYFQATNPGVEELEIAAQARFYLPPTLLRFAIDKTIPIEKRKVLLSLVQERKSFKSLIVEHFGCSEQFAEEAETLVVEFLKATHEDESSQLEIQNDLQTSLPDKPPKYYYAPRMRGGIERYLRDNWYDYINSGLLTRPDLRRIDPTASQALTNWLRNNQLPEDLRLLSKSAQVDKDIQRLGVTDAREAERLAAALKRRTGNPSSGPKT